MLSFRKCLFGVILCWIFICIIVLIYTDDTAEWDIDMNMTVNMEHNESGMNIIDAMVANLKIIKTNVHYRVGDLLFCKGYRYLGSTYQIINNDTYNNTILYKYFTGIGYDKNNLNQLILSDNQHKQPIDWDLLRNIIKIHIETNNFKIPDKNELVIHLRAGDVVDRKQFMNIDYIHEKMRIIYFVVTKYKNINKITFVSGLNFSPYSKRYGTKIFQYSNMSELINKKRIENLIQDIYNDITDNVNRDISFQLISHSDIDRDLCYLANAKYLVLDYGGFDDVVNGINTNYKFKLSTDAYSQTVSTFFSCDICYEYNLKHSDTFHVV